MEGRPHVYYYGTCCTGVAAFATFMAFAGTAFIAFTVFTAFIAFTVFIAFLAAAFAFRFGATTLIHLLNSVNVCLIATEC